VAHLPSEITQTGKDFGAALRDDQDWGKALRDLNNPKGLGGLIPGVWAGAEASTPEGRQQLQQHPVSTLLDVLPMARGAGKLGTTGASREVAGAGRDAEAAARKGGATEEEARSARFQATEQARGKYAGTPTEAFMRGNPIKGTARVATRNLPGIRGKGPFGLHPEL